MKTALVTGITGQSGSYLAELLLEKGYEVHGIVRRTSSIENSTWRIMNVIDKLHLHEGDLCDAGSLDRIVTAIQPDEVYNLGAQSHVAVSFQVPEHTGDVIALGTLRLLEAVRKHAPNARFYQASTSEMFGASAPPQGETTMFHPRSPYGVAKLAAHWYTINARESYGLHASCGILFNHESPRRGETFVTRKITKAVAAIAIGTQEKVSLGNLNALRDWGFAGDYVRAMWMMLQQEQPGDYVIATGETHSVREFVKAAFDHVGLDWTKHVEIDPKFCRPAEVHALCGNPFKAHAVLGWTPEVSFTQLVKMMVDYDLALAQHEQATGMVKRVVVPSTST